MGWEYLSWHFLAAGIWSGCVATDVLIEHLVDRSQCDNAVTKLVAQYQYWSDLCLQLPMSLFVTVTGLKLMIGRTRSSFVHSMAGLSCVATILRISAFPFTYRKYQASLINDWNAVENNDKWQKRFRKGAGHTVLLTLALSLVMSKKDY
jgi:hypothetical protein